MTTVVHYAYRSIFPGLILGILTILMLVVLGDVVQVELHLNTFRWQFMAVAVMLDLVNQLLRFFKYFFLLRQAGVRTLALEQQIDLFLSTSSLNAATARESDAFQAVWLSKSADIPLSQADAIMLIHRIADVLSVLVLGTLGTISYPRFWPFFLVLFITFLLVTISLKIKPTSSLRPSFSPRRSEFAQIWDRIQFAAIHNPELFTIPSLMISFGLRALAWMAHGGALFAILVGFGFSPSLALTATSCLVISFAMLMGFISNMPGGLGVFELSMAVILTILLNFQPELAAVVTILFRLATFWTSFLFGILVWPQMERSITQNAGASRVAKS